MIYNPYNALIGSKVLGFTSSNQTYSASYMTKDFNPSIPTTKTNINDNLGSPLSVVLRDDWITGTTTVETLTTASVIPSRGWTFRAPLTGSQSSPDWQLFIVEKVDISFTNDQSTKFSVTYTQVP